MFATVLVVSLACAAEPEHLGPMLGVRCGRIIIEGNTDTPDAVVYDLLDIRPGQRIVPDMLRRARQRLRSSPAFVTNRWQGVGAVVELVPPGFPSEFWDVRVRVVDRPGSWLAYSVARVVELGVCAALFPEPEVLRALRRELDYIADHSTRDGDGGP